MWAASRQIIRCLVASSSCWSFFPSSLLSELAVMSLTPLLFPWLYCSSYASVSFSDIFISNFITSRCSTYLYYAYTSPEWICRLQVAGGGKGKMVSYPYFMAFISLLNNMELLKQIYVLATKRSSVTELTKGFHLLFLCLSCLSASRRRFVCHCCNVTHVWWHSVH